MSVSLLLIPGALAIAGAVGGVGALGFNAQLRAGRLPENTEGAEVVDRAPSDAAGHPAAPMPVQVRTRMKDATLLAAALKDLGAKELSVTPTEVSAQLGGQSLTMELDSDGIWEAHIAGATEAEAAGIIASLDSAYALRVQQTIAERIRQRAGDAGFSLLSETREEDRSLTMVLEVRGGAG